MNSWLYPEVLFFPVLSQTQSLSPFSWVMNSICTRFSLCSVAVKHAVKREFYFPKKLAFKNYLKRFHLIEGSFVVFIFVGLKEKLCPFLAT